MRRIASLAMLRVERTPEVLLDLTPGLLLILGGVSTVLLAAIR